MPIISNVSQPSIMSLEGLVPSSPIDPVTNAPTFKDDATIGEALNQGAIVTTPESGYFLKMVGPDKTMKAARPAFEAMIKTIAVEK